MPELEVLRPARTEAGLGGTGWLAMPGRVGRSTRGGSLSRPHPCHWAMQRPQTQGGRDERANLPAQTPPHTPWWWGKGSSRVAGAGLDGLWHRRGYLPRPNTHLCRRANAGWHHHRCHRGPVAEPAAAAHSHLQCQLGPRGRWPHSGWPRHPHPGGLQAWCYQGERSPGPQKACACSRC